MHKRSGSYALILGASISVALDEALALASQGRPMLLVASQMGALQSLRAKLPQNVDIQLFVCDVYDVDSRLQLLENIASLHIAVDSLHNHVGQSHIWGKI